MPFKERLCAGHRDGKMRPRFWSEIDVRERLPIAILIGIDQALTDIAVLSSARLRPEAVQNEVSGVKAIWGLVRAFWSVGVAFTETGLPTEG